MRRQVLAKNIDTFGPDKLIVPRLADLQWAERVRPRSDAAGPETATPSSAPVPPADGQADLVDEADAPEADSYRDGSRRKAIAEARIAEVNARRAEGNVYDKARTDQAVADAFRKLSERVFAAPKRAAASTAGLAEPREIEAIFEDELRKAFSEWDLSIRPHLAQRLEA